MRRALAAAIGLSVAGCMVTTPVGTYRLAVQTGEQEVAIRTFVARFEDAELVLVEGASGLEFGRGTAGSSWTRRLEPYTLGPQPYPLTLYLRDGVFQDAATRPWATAPSAPIASEATSLVRARLSGEGGTMTVFLSGGGLFADGPMPQPAIDAVPPPLVVMGSPAGAGVVIPGDVSPGVSWKDAMSMLVPPDAQAAVPCGAPLTALLRADAIETVSVPAGEFETVRVSESIDSCLLQAPEDVKVFAIVRWFAPGLGPVKMRYQASDAKWREYRLVEFQGAVQGSELWPVASDRAWAYEVRGPEGDVVSPKSWVRVETVEVVPSP